MKRALLGLAAGSLLAAAGPAHGAELRTLPDGVTAAGGPVLAGASLAWPERDLATRSTRTVVRLPGGELRTVAQYDRASSDMVVLAASPERLAALHLLPGKSGDLPSLRFGAVGAELAPGDLCSTGPDTVVVTERAYGLRCGDQFVVRDEDLPGQARSFPIRQRTAVALAGRFAAYRTAVTVVVADRITGEERLRVSTPPNQYGTTTAQLDVQEDGTVAFTTPGGTSWASPSDPTVHQVAPHVGELRIAGGRIAVGVPTNEVGTDVVRVFGLDGTVVGEGVVVSSGRWDFDGRRVAYERRPCAITTIAVTEPGAEPARSLGEGCAAPRLATRALRLGPDRRVTVTLRCPAGGDRGGCGDRVELCLPRRRGVTPCAQAPYYGSPGETSRVRLAFSPAEAAVLRRLGRPRLILTAAELRTSVRVRARA